MIKLNRERRWFLNHFKFNGWSVGRPNLQGVKKWEAHKAALLKNGLLETDEYGLFRITDAGNAALSEETTA